MDEDDILDVFQSITSYAVDIIWYNLITHYLEQSTYR
jgi:hypothetical protein